MDRRPPDRAGTALVGDLGAVLAIGPFRRFWTAMAVSSLGDWLGLLAVTAMAVDLTAQAGYAAQNFAVAGVLLLRLLPALVLAPLAGVVADRFDRRRTMVVGDVLRAVIVVSIPLVGTLPWLLVATLLMEAVALFWLPAKEATVPNLVPPGRLPAANQLALLATYGSAPVAAALFTLLALVTKALGAQAVGIGPVDLALFLDAVTFAASAVLIAGVRTSRRPVEPPGESMLRAAVDGWRFIARTPVVRGLVLGILGAVAAAGVVIGLGRTFVADLDAGDAGYGLLFGGVFVGLALGMVVGPAVTRGLTRRRTFGASLVSAAVALMLVALAQNLVIVLGAVGVLGFFAGVAWVTALTVLGLEVADGLRGRTFAAVAALMRITLAAVLALAPFVAGSIGQHRVLVGDAALDYDGAAITMLVAAGLALAAGVLAYRQMDDRPGVPFWRDVLGAVMGRGTSWMSGTGLLVALEGGDGAGKSTQARLLADWLRDKGHEVLLTHEPGDSAIGPALRRLLLDPDVPPLAVRTEALLYAADRAEHVASVVRPALSRGAVVVTDRYLDSSIAYQGAGRDLPADDVERLSAFATDGLLPQLTVLLDVDAAVGAARRLGTDKLEAEPDDFHGRVRAAFLALAARSPQRYLLVDAGLPPDEIATLVRERVAPLLPTPAARDRAMS